VVTAIRRGREFKDSLYGAPPNTSGADYVTERGLRAALVEAYGTLADNDLKEVLETKQKDPWSFFYAYRDISSALKHWQWYLLCLSYDEDTFEQTGGIDEGVVRMPMDTVDLRAIATIYRVQITVSRFLEEPLRFCPSNEIPQTAWSTCHLIGHDGLWAPVLRSRPSSDEDVDLIGKIVKLDSLLPHIEKLASYGSALITDYDEDREHYMAKVEDVTFPVERAQISQILDFQKPAVVDELADRYELVTAPRAGEAPPLYGIPDGSLEFQVLKAMVLEHVKTRLLDTRASLAGRARPPPPNSYFRYFLRGHDFGSSAYGKVQVYNVSADVAQRARRLQLEQAEAKAAEARALVAPSLQSDLNHKMSMYYAKLDRSKLPAHELEQKLLQSVNGGFEIPREAPCSPVDGAPTISSSAPSTNNNNNNGNGLVFVGSAPAGPGPSGFFREMLLERAQELFASHRTLAAFVVLDGRSAPIPADRDSDSSISVPIQRGWVVNLSEYSPSGFFLGSPAQQPIMGAIGPSRQAWFPARCFLRFQAVKNFRPESSWPNASKMMPLQTGDQVLVKRHLVGDWKGWVVGSSHKDQSVSGIFPEANIKPHLMLSG